MRIGILQTGHAPEPMQASMGDYPDFFARLLAPHGLQTQTWDVTRLDLPADPHAAGGWLITGSRHGAYEDHPWIAPLEAFIRKVVAAQVPLVGICFGHQIIAQALGGRVEKFPGGWSVGRTEYAFEGGQTLALNAWHQDQVMALPEGARTIATAPGCAHAAFVVGDTVLTYQAHPEYEPEAIAGLIEHRGGAIPEALTSAARARLDQPLDNHAAAARIAAFLRGAGASDVA